LQASQDVLIIDSPPLRVVTDAAILSAFVDGTLLVIDATTSRRAAVRLGREALNRVNAQVDGYHEEVTEEPVPPSGAWPKVRTTLEDRLKGRPAGTSETTDRT